MTPIALRTKPGGQMLAEAKSIAIGVGGVMSSIMMVQATVIGDSALAQWGSLAVVVTILLYFNKQAEAREERQERRIVEQQTKYESQMERWTALLTEIRDELRGR